VPFPVVQFHIVEKGSCVIPKRRVFTSDARDLPRIALALRIHRAGDPSLRLKSGSTQDDADRVEDECGED
jgi:hypothetical protein